MKEIKKEMKKTDFVRLLFDETFECELWEQILMKNFFIFTELVHGEYFLVKDEKDSTIEHFIQFSMSLRGKPAIMGKSTLVGQRQSQMCNFFLSLFTSGWRSVHRDERKPETCAMAMQFNVNKDSKVSSKDRHVQRKSTEIRVRSMQARTHDACPRFVNFHLNLKFLILMNFL